MITAVRKPIEEIIQCVSRFAAFCWPAATSASRSWAAGDARKWGSWPRRSRCTSCQSRQAFRDPGSDASTASATRNTCPKLRVTIDHVDAVVSMACGCGIQEVARRFHNKPVFPALNTKFMGATEARGSGPSAARAVATASWGPRAASAPSPAVQKRCFNGPCGGSTNGKCEIEPGCRLRLAAHLRTAQRPWGMTGKFEENRPTKDWTTEPAAGDRGASSERIWHYENGKHPGNRDTAAMGDLAVTTECGPPRSALPA